MIDRFLRYSQQHGKKILLMVMNEKGIRRMNVMVAAIRENEVDYTTARSGKVKTLAVSDILSAAYARGDDGDTLKNEQTENENG